MSTLMKSMELLTEIFKKYSGKDGDSQTLTKSELADLLRNEMPCAGAPSQSALEQFFKALDTDGDGVVNFTEYVTFVATLCVILNE